MSANEIKQDEIIRMAQQVQDEGLAPVGIWPEVRRLCELAYAAGAAHEREACAKVCDELKATYELDGLNGTKSYHEAAAAIRARGEE